LSAELNSSKQSKQKRTARMIRQLPNPRLSEPLWIHT
jgi:hypothetical protein